jgi:hypothetical protein
MTDTLYLGSEMIAPESFLEGRKYKVTYECDRCGHQWSRVYKTIPKVDPPCPTMDCRVAARVDQELREQRNFQSIVDHGAPGVIGANPAVQAIDKTAEIVMRDHGLTDLRDNVREGEIMAPKLRPDLQAKADSVFARKPQSRTVGRRLNALATAALRGQSMGGVVTSGPVTPADVFKNAAGSRVLHHVGTEKFRS